jgi:hypothetical protein
VVSAAERHSAESDAPCAVCDPHPKHGRYACRRNGDLCGCPGENRVTSPEVGKP